MGFSLADVAKLRGRLREGQSFSEAVRETARRRLERIDGEIAESRRLQDELSAFLARCGARPPDQPRQILTELAKLDAVARPPAK